METWIRLIELNKVNEREEARGEPVEREISQERG